MVTNSWTILKAEAINLDYGKDSLVIFFLLGQIPRKIQVNSKGGLNRFRGNRKFKYKKVEEKIIFFDLVIKLIESKIVTDLYCKSTDSQYLHSLHKN